MSFKDLRSPNPVKSSWLMIPQPPLHPQASPPPLFWAGMQIGDCERIGVLWNHDFDEIYVFIKKLVFGRKIRAVEILKLGAVQTDAIAT
jgi:hypothetical protein